MTSSSSFEGHDREHGAENLLLGKARAVVDVGKDGRLDEIAAVESFRPASARDKARALLFPDCDIALGLGELFGGSLRPDVRLLVERQADANPLGAGSDLLQKRVVDRTLDEKPRAERAGLSVERKAECVAITSARSRSASAKMMCGDLPPHSSVSRLRLPDAACMIFCAVT